MDGVALKSGRVMNGDDEGKTKDVGRNSFHCN